LHNGGKLVRWVDIGRLGYLGKHRDEMCARWDSKYGKGNWRLAWKVGMEYVDFLQMCKYYEESYYRFLKGHEEILGELVHAASDVYDDAVSNLHSGFEYNTQETNRTHVQDIAIRNAVRRLGSKFKGDELLQIRDREGSHALSMELSPGRVPFYDKSIIVQPELGGWWKPGTVESFYQSNRMLQKKNSG
jgi:hypothetical protein